MQSRLLSLTLGNFAIGAGAMIITGMLNDLSVDLATSPARIGMLMSVFSIVVCVTGPFLAGWTSAIERRKLLAASLALYAVMHLAAALAPGYDSLLVVRALTAIGAALFTAQAAATAGVLVPGVGRGKAVGLVFLGWSIAAVAGTPMGAYLGGTVGWRPAMGVVAVVSALSALWVWRRIPAGLHVSRMSGAAWRSLFSDVPLLLSVSVTAIHGIGMFVMVAYMALILKDFVGATPAMLSLLFLCLGFAGVSGNLIGMRAMDRIGPVRVGMAAMACMVTAALLWPLTRGSLPVTIAMILLWGSGGFALNSAQQVRLIALAPPLASASVSLNSSAIYLGQATGAFIGGVVVSTLGSAYLSFFAAAPMALAMAVSWLAANMARRRSAACAS